MDVRIVPVPLKGTVRVPASKSELHRLLICAAFADGPVRIGAVPGHLSEDIEATVRCIRSLGASVETGDDYLHVVPAGEVPVWAELDCGESGSTLRMLLPAAAAVCGSLRVIGSGSLPGRPLGALTEEMKRHGVSFSSDMLPFETSGILKGGRYSIPGNITSQYLSGLLMASPLVEGETSVELSSDLASAGYAELTMDIMERFGRHVEKDGVLFKAQNGRYISPSEIDAGGDWSSAAVFLAAAAAGKDCEVTLTGLDCGSRQPDSAVLEILRAAGADLDVAGDAVTVRSSELGGLSADAAEVPDLIPVLSAAACAAGDASVFSGCGRLKFKESDRLSALKEMLSHMGASAVSDGDVFTVRGADKGVSCETDSYGDHRMVMAAVAAAYALSVPVTVRNAEAVTKSYPRFFDDLRRLGGEADVI